jgi:hypothetical protein
MGSAEDPGRPRSFQLKFNITFIVMKTISGL